MMGRDRRVLMTAYARKLHRGDWEMVAVSRILVRADHRRHTDADVAALAEDIARNHLTQPPCVVVVPGTALYVVVAGVRRVEAVKMLGHKSLACCVIP